MEYYRAFSGLSDPEKWKVIFLSFVILFPYCSIWVVFSGVIKFSNFNSACSSFGVTLADCILYGNSGLIFLSLFQIFRNALVKFLMILTPFLYCFFSWGLMLWATYSYWNVKNECLELITMERTWILINGGSLAFVLLILLTKLLIWICSSCNCCFQIMADCCGEFFPGIRNSYFFRKRALGVNSNKPLDDSLNKSSVVIWNVKSKEPVLTDLEMKKILRHL